MTALPTRVTLVSQLLRLGQAGRDRTRQAGGSGRAGWGLSWLLYLGGWLLPQLASAQGTQLGPGDIIITAVQCTNPDDFVFVPLVDIAAGTQIIFTDNGWFSSGGFRNFEGTATYVAPADIAKGTSISFQGSQANFTVTSQFALSTDGDQLLCYQGTAAAPVFICGYTKTRWSDATSANTSALPPGLRNGVTAVATSWINTYMNQLGLWRGAPGQLRPWFNTATNWTGSNSQVNNSAWPNQNLTVESGQATAGAGTITPNSTLNRVQELVLTESNFATYVLGGELALVNTTTTACNPTAVKSARLLLQLDTGPSHDVNDKANPFAAAFDLTVTGCLGNGKTCVLPVLNTLPVNGPLQISTTGLSQQTPRQVYVVDLLPYVNANATLTRVSVQISSLVVSPAGMRRHLRLVARLEQELRVAPPQPTLTATATSSAAYDQFETSFAWVSACPLVQNYQVQILKLPEQAAGTTPTAPTDAGVWEREAMLLETGSSATTLTTSIAGGTGTYAWRVRGIGNVNDGGIANPENWGTWSSVGFKTLTTPSATAKWTTDLNWIYSRNFSEGGREKEQLTFANGLLHTRQTQTKLHLETGSRILGLQTLQDYVGRNAVQSLPIPLPGSANPTLGFRSGLLTAGQSGTTPYNASHFDANATVGAPSQATELGQYYSGTAPTDPTYPANDGVASAELYPFTRTLYSRDGTNRVREQASAGATLGLAAASGVKRTLRTAYGSVAQSELTRLFGAAEAPAAENTYKIITQDANNTGTVTYQTKAGQTIATALIGNSGANNLQPLPSAAASAFTVTDHLNNNVPDGSTGSISSKLLIVPAGGLDLTLAYDISPNTVQDLCGQCSTCDYRVEIAIRNIDDPSLKSVVPPFVAALTSCGAPVSPLPAIPLIQLTEAGTYLIEKRVVAYTSPTAAAGTVASTYLDSRLAAMQTDYEALKTGTTVIQPGNVTWADIVNALKADNTSKTKVADLYARLAAAGYQQQTIDGVANYVLKFGCSSNQSVIYLPILNTDCGPATSCSTTNLPTPYPDAGFEQYLLANLQIPGGAASGTTVYSYFPDLGQQGNIDAMFTALLGTASPYNGQCAKAWGCWRAVIDMFNASSSSQLGNTIPANNLPNLQRQFLQCFEADITQVTTSPLTPGQVYNTLFFDANNSQHQNCLASVLPQAGLPASATIQDLQLRQDRDQATHPSNPEDYAYLQSVYDCIQASANGQTPTTSGQTLTNEQVAAVQQTAMQQCENRRAEFRQNILREFRRQGIYTYLDQYELAFDSTLKTYLPTATPHQFDANSDVEECEVDLMVEELVVSCREQCQLTVSYDPATNLPVYNPSELERMKAAMLYRAEVQLRKVGAASCDPPTSEPLNVNFTPSHYLPAPLKSVRLSKCAEDLIAYATALIGTANSIPNIATNTTRPALGRPAGGIGIGEVVPGILSYVGALDVGCNRVFSPDAATFAPDREHYWVTVQDGRVSVNSNPKNIYRGPGLYRTPADSAGSTNSIPPFVYNYFNASDFSNPNYDYQSDFRVIWGYHDLPGMLGNFPYVCYANGDDVPGVPKLLEPSSDVNATFDYIFHFVDLNGNPIPKEKILTVSAPYLDANAPQIPKYDDPFATAAVRVNLVLKTGQTVVAGLELRPANPQNAPASVTDPDDYLAHFLMWKEVEECNIQNRKFTSCFRFVEPIVKLDPNDNLYNPVPPDCQATVAATLRQSIEAQQSAWIQTQLTYFQQQYATQCASPTTLRDDLTVQYTLGHHHFTLYYYDRAGNLTRTIPPAGVELVDPAAVPAQVPQHRLATTYEYNSLKQLVRQTTPDGGTTDFIYNRIGQLRFSVNDKQGQPTALRYSYTNYDALGRPIETGESSQDVPTTAATGLTLRQTFINQFTAIKAELTDFPSRTVSTPQTRTVYDVAYANVSYLNQVNAQSQATRPPRYLTNRVAYTESFNDASSVAPDVRTHYSYDPHGNVEWLAQDIPNLGRKFTRYEYDLISNKVLLVAYQEGQPDQFLHRYEYDAENRLLAVATSADGVVWDQDATYTYYTHGPLKRQVLGQDKVQGLDYTYTLQGWLKSINQPDLTGTNDPGRDAATSSPSGAAADAFGMVLNYYQGDYKHAGIFPDASQANSPIFQPVVTGSGTSTVDQNLYNGNIATWQSDYRQDVPTQASGAAIAPAVNELYRYDQLNRLLSSRQYTVSGTTRTETKAFATNYTYDASGNLLTLSRRDGAGTQFDALHYNYLEKQSTPTSLQSNRLSFVDDQGVTTYAGQEVQDQSGYNTGSGGVVENNYGYDELGNLTRDKQSGVTNIEWTLAGKVKVVRKDDPAYPGDASRATYVSYRYDAQGQRVSKDVAVGSAGQRHTYYVRDAQGNILAVYDQAEASGQLQAAILREQPIYGSSRLGERKPDLTISGMMATTAPYYTRTIGQKAYEVVDHLSNVRAVVSDQKQSMLAVGTLATQLSTFAPTLRAYTNYYAFGMQQPGRYAPGNGTTNGGYRFGYNNKEKDDNGELGLTTYDYGFRIYNPGLGKFLSIDPLAPKYPWYTPYQFAGNTPIQAIDLDGLEPVYSQRIYKGYPLEDENEDGKVTPEERKGAFQAMAIYTMIALDVNVFRGRLSTFYMAYLLGDGIDHGEKALKARQSGDTQTAKAESEQSKESYTQFGIGLATMGVTRAGGALINRLVLRKISANSIALIETHLANPKFAGGVVENKIMIQRLKDILSGEIKATSVDMNFHAHELREIQMMSKGMSYEAAHEAVLKEQGMYVKNYDQMLYTKEAIEASEAAERAAYDKKW